MSREISYKYLEELKDEIIEAFNDYELEFGWKPGWAGGIYSFIPPHLEVIGLGMKGENSEILSQIKESDEEILTNFITETVKIYTDTFKIKSGIEYVPKTIKVEFDAGSEEDPPVLSVMVFVNNPDYKG